VAVKERDLRRQLRTTEDRKIGAIVLALEAGMSWRTIHAILEDPAPFSTFYRRWKHLAPAGAGR
jgi:hypothetical protein